MDRLAGFFLYALEEFTKQREDLGLEDSADGFLDFLALPTNDALRRCSPYLFESGLACPDV